MTTVDEFTSNVADSARFLDAVRLTEADDAPAGHRAFTATTQYVPWPKAYGGDLVPGTDQASREVVDLRLDAAEPRRVAVRDEGDPHPATLSPTRPGWPGR